MFYRRGFGLVGSGARGGLFFDGGREFFSMRVTVETASLFATFLANGLRPFGVTRGLTTAFPVTARAELHLLLPSYSLRASRSIPSPTGFTVDEVVELWRIVVTTEASGGFVAFSARNPIF
ncbi:MAG: hypothetical protein G01um101420_484 [Parcubacteria group bacterium Gr01-1014_20]|nr:MAG: hypothetical protein G01um101420_484 [Parcubacteria group bacterium Gr01-1014_20]